MRARRAHPLMHGKGTISYSNIVYTPVPVHSLQTTLLNIFALFKVSTSWYKLWIVSTDALCCHRSKGFGTLFSLSCLARHLRQQFWFEYVVIGTRLSHIRSSCTYGRKLIVSIHKTFHLFTCLLGNNTESKSCHAILYFTIPPGLRLQLIYLPAIDNLPRLVWDWPNCQEP